MNGFKRIDYIADDRALGAAGCSLSLFRFDLEVRLNRCADDHDAQFLIIFDGIHRVGGAQHVLVDEIAQCQQVGMVADGHHRHDFLTVEIERQRTFRHHVQVNRLAVLVEAGHGSRQAFGRWVWGEKITHGALLGRKRRGFKRDFALLRHACCATLSKRSACRRARIAP